MDDVEFECFSDWLRHYRTKQRYSMRSLGKAVGVSGTYISTLENHQDLPEDMSPRPSAGVVEKIAGVLGADADQGKRLAGLRRSCMHQPPKSILEPDDAPADKSWRETLHDMEEKLGELPTARVEKMVALWKDQFIPHYNLYRQFQEEERELEQIKRQRRHTVRRTDRDLYKQSVT